MRQRDMGMPETPPLRAFENANYQSYEDGYDSNGFQAPFYDAVMSENDLGVDEEELAEAPPGVASAALGENFAILGENANRIGVVNILEEEMKKLKVSELKDELHCCDCSIAGNKPVLFDRLKDAVQDNLPCLDINTEGGQHDL
eukprot:CAMPEP_0195506540 /NCGR_PEP_ID=MMETSP0794_2-20130614/99_1 /TAXON_ID=515487 /ORGANISM="Stephanopyxis turris, Strain CCMP 815" /LENGTH=143 /DNA_ID=CAMNT_0040632867 /DNA_START=52 /DNA_END=483 /DNA_ORIENTATION=+